jgi:hypothetical protein
MDESENSVWPDDQRAEVQGILKEYTTILADVSPSRSNCIEFYGDTSH